MTDQHDTQVTLTLTGPRAERPALDELLARQGVAGPQGLDALADSEWVGDESDERYLAALSGEA